jgi:hypothetical protein
MVTSLTELALAVSATPLASGFDPWELAPPGVWLIFGVIGLPVYIAFLGWFLGKPREIKTSVLGSVTFLSLVLLLWGGLYALTMGIRLVFY